MTVGRLTSGKETKESEMRQKNQCTMSPGQRLGYHIEKMIDPILLGCF